MTDRPLRSWFTAAALLLGLPALPSAQVEYRLRFDPAEKDPSWQVEARFPGRGEETLDYWIARWTAGAYHVADYARFVPELTATDERGTTLAVERPETSHFVVRGAGGAGEILIRYRARSLTDSVLSNDVIDVEGNRIRPAYAYVNPVSLFGFVPARIDEPVRLAVELPAGWKAATVLERDAQGRYEAPSYYRFEDSPLLFSPTLETARFEVEGKPHEISVHGRPRTEVEKIAEGCRKIVAAGSSLMQGLPYDRYHFLFGFVPEAQGSGLEHSFSTLILLNEEIRSVSDSFWDIVAHEYFHLWCAERIHVQGIERPDYTRPFVTGTIWVNEGVTEYMTRHVLLQAGMIDQAELLGALAGPLPFSGPQASWTAVSRDFGGEGQPLMTVAMPFMMKMYMLGPRTILALDLEMRRASGGERGVLDLLRFLRWAYVEKQRGFDEDEMSALIDGVAAADLGDFYRRFIDGPEVPDLAPLLAVIGYRVDGERVVPLESPSEAQLAARQDFFSATGR